MPAQPVHLVGDMPDPDTAETDGVKTLIAKNDSGEESVKEVKPIDELDYKAYKADEELAIMKAKAGELVETIRREDSRPVKVLYMTNTQAVEVSENSDAMEKMKEALCGRKQHYLIIDLVQSWGFYQSTKIMGKQMFEDKQENIWNAGIEHATSPFKSLEEEQETINQINQFMINVIIPLAEKTSAIVLCNAVVHDCILSECFTNMIEMMASKWHDNPPFTVVGTLGCVNLLYRNKDKSTTWAAIRDKCSVWKKRQNQFPLEDSDSENEYKHDLTWKTRNLLIVEGMDTEFSRVKKRIERKKNRAPFSLLMTSLMRHIGKDSPQLAIKTGACARDDHILKWNSRGIQDMSYMMLKERANANASIVCLDVRKRPQEAVSPNGNIHEGQDAIIFHGGQKDVPEDEEKGIIKRKHQKSTKKETKEKHNRTKKLPREKVIKRIQTYEIIKKKVQEEFEEIRKSKLSCENLDCCMLAYLHRLLCTLTLDSSDNELVHLQRAGIISNTIAGKDEKNKNITSLDEAIETMEHNKKATKYQNFISTKLDIDHAKYANMFAWEFYNNLPHGAKGSKDSNGEYVDVASDGDSNSARKYFSGQIQTTAAFAIQLLTYRRLYNINIWDELVDQACQIDQIFQKGNETEPTLEGLRLLKTAWDAVDSSRELANFYQFFSTTLFKLQLILGFLLTFLSVTVGYRIVPEELKFLILWLSLFLGASVTFDTIFSPRSYMYQLRTAQVRLESIIWKYRTRVGQFEVDQTNANQNRPEERLSWALKEWSEQLSWATNPSATGVHGLWTRKKLKERTSSKVSKFNDDHYSYLDGKGYVKFRLLQEEEGLLPQYESKVPGGLFRQYKFNIIIVFLGVVIAIISEQINTHWGSAIVTILTALVASITSYMEFTDTVKYANINTDAIMECQHLINKWTELTRFMTQSRDSTTELVEEVENTVNQVMTSWSTSITKKSGIHTNDSSNSNFRRTDV